MAATNLTGQRTTSPEQVILQQIADRNAQWQSEDNAWAAESSKYQSDYDAFMSTKPNRDTDYATFYNREMSHPSIVGLDYGTWLRVQSAVIRDANKYADTRQSEFLTTLTGMQNTRASRVTEWNKTLSGRSNQLERYLDLQAQDAKNALARAQGVEQARRGRGSASFLADEELSTKGQKSYLTGA